MGTVDERWLGFYRCWEFSTLEEFKKAAAGGKLDRSLRHPSGDYRITGNVKYVESEERKTHSYSYPDFESEVSSYLFSIPVTRNLITLEDETAEVEISYEDIRKLEVLRIGLEDRIEAEGSIPVGNEPYDVEEIRKI